MTIEFASDMPAHSSRSLPDFLVIGVTKGGTTALIRNLGRHPDVYTARDGKSQELHFFNKKWDMGLDWYRKHFIEPEKLQGEKTPNYLMSPLAHARMAATVPNAKLIISVRNPVDRAYSHWNHFNQVAHRKAGWDWRVMDFQGAIRQPDRTMSTLINSGYYMKHIRKLLKFYPRNQIHIIISERLRKNPDGEYSKLLEFLNLKEAPIPFRNEHERDYEEPIDPRIRQLLAEHYQVSNMGLADFLNDEIPEWSI